MILEKEFYFIRHGQTDHNISEDKKEKKLQGEQAGDTPLNKTGRNQAKNIEPIISSLPIRTVCSSPLKRAQETKEIITLNLQVAHHDIHDLGECSIEIWNTFAQLGTSSPKEGVARQFIDQVRNGLNQALALPGPSLIVAHGGVHWAICCLMGIEDHEWKIANCVPVHFSIGSHGKWSARKLT